MRIPFRLTHREWLFAVLISSVHGMQHLFNRLLPAIIPILVLGLDTPLWQLGLLVSVYMFMGGIGQAPMGVLSDRVDRQYLLIPSIVLMSLGYLLFALAPGLGSALPSVTLFEYTFTGYYQIMVLGMCISGLGFSGIHPVGYPLISENISYTNKGKVLGMWASAAKIGDMAGPVLVGIGILILTWEHILLGISAFGLLYAIGLFVVLREGTFETRPAVLNEQHESGSATATDLFANPQLVLFPLIAVVLFFFLILFAGNGLMTFTPVFVSDVYAYSFSIAGVSIEPTSVANFYFAAMLLSGAVAQLLVGGLADVYDHRTVLAILVSISSVCLYILAFMTLTPATLLLIFVALGGCIFGLYPARDALISDITPPEFEGRAFGYIFTFVMVGGSVFPVVIGYLADTIGIQASFTYLALGSSLSLVCLGFLYSKRIYQERPTAVASD